MDFLDPQRLLGSHIDKLPLDSAVAIDNSFGQRGLLRLPIPKSDKRDQQYCDQRNDPPNSRFRDFCHGRLASRSPVARVLWFRDRWAPITCRSNWSVLSFRRASVVE